MVLGKGPTAKRIREDTSVPRDEGSSAPISNEGTDNELMTLEETASPGGEIIPIETESSNSVETPIESNNDDVIFQTVVEETGPLENLTILDFGIELTHVDSLAVPQHEHGVFPAIALCRRPFPKEYAKKPRPPLW